MFLTCLTIYSTCELLLKPIEVPVKDKLDLYIEELIKMECRNCPPNFSKIDNDGVKVFGCLQYKETTFREKVKRYKMLPDTTDEEVMNMIYDCSFQKALTKKIFTHESYGWRLWKVSVRKIGYLPKI